MKKILYFLLFLFSSSFATPSAYTPWYTGTFFTRGAVNLPPHMYGIQAYFLLGDSMGFFDDNWKRIDRPSIHNYTLDLYMSAGLTKYLDINANIAELYTKENDIHATHVSDTSLSFGIQLKKAKPKTSELSIRLLVREVFPTGKYKDLDPAKKRLDATGGGSFKTGFSLHFEKMLYWFYHHPMRTRLNFSYILPATAHVNNFHTYGGGYGTNGKVRPGKMFATSFALEYSLNKRWAVGTDIRYSTINGSKFSGDPGKTLTGKVAQNGLPSSTLISMAPALEYSFSEKFGVVGAIWFPLRGRNTLDFVSGGVSAVFLF